MSYWNKDIANQKRFALKENESSDVCIIGAGLAGLTTAYYLSRNKMKVVVLEANQICSGVSSRTTGKITSQHGLFYDYLVKSFGVDFARKYLEANEKAIKNIEEIINKEKIDCDFEKQSSYVFSDDENEKSLFEGELGALEQIGFNTKYISNLDIPIKNFGGIEFKNQAMFNPAKYAYGLANSSINNGAKIYENSKVIDIKHQKGMYKVYTEDNYIESKYVVLATHFPIKNFPGAYFLKMYQDISYIIAVKSKDKTFEGYYINNKEPAISFRNVKNNVQKDLKSEMDKENTDNITLISGNGHKVGRESDTDNYKFLEDVAKGMFKENYEIIDRWSTQDCVSMDKLPFIGRFSRLLPNIYVMTGFKKWGMTLSNIAANIVSDEVQNKENEYEELFKPSRMKIIKNAKSYKEHIKETVYGIGLNKLKLPNETIKDIKNGEGKIVIYNGKKIGVYKDENGFCNLVKPICTHLKCELQFNNTDKTWDCPCHGSRFTIKGEVINNPAVYKLKNNIKM